MNRSNKWLMEKGLPMNPITLANGFIEIALVFLEDKDYWYSFHRLRVIEYNLIRLWCKVNEDVFIP